MRVHRRGYQQPARLQIGDYRFVRVFAEHTLYRLRRGQFASLVYSLNKRQTVRLAHARVVLAERRRDVDYACAVRQRYVTVRYDLIAIVFTVIRTVKRSIVRAYKFAAFIRSKRFVFFEVLAREFFRENVFSAFGFNKYIFVIGIDAQRDVGRKGPRRSRPCQKLTAAAEIRFERRDRGALGNVGVALRDFVRGKRRSATRTVRNDLMPFVYQSALENVFKRPPDRLDVVVVVRHVRVFHVRPITDALRHALPLGLILPHALFALRNKRFDAVLFYIMLAVDLK